MTLATMLRSGVAAGAVMAGLAGLAPGSAAAAEALLMLNWFPLADHSPIFLAKERGYYDEAGIELEIQRGQGSGDTAQKVALGQAQFGIADTPTIINAIARDADLTIIGMVYDRAANNAFFAADSGIEKPADLAGRSVALPPADSHRNLWPAFAQSQGIDADSIELVNVKPEGKQAIVAAGQVDASFDLYTSYPIWEKVLGKDNVGNLLWADYGFELYGHAYFVQTSLIEEQPELVRGFMEATYRGWKEAQEEPEAAIDALTANVDGVDRDAYIATLPYVFDLVITERSAEHGLGWILEDLMQQTIDLTAAGGTLERVPVAADIFTNEFNAKIMP